MARFHRAPRRQLGRGEQRGDRVRGVEPVPEVGDEVEPQLVAVVVPVDPGGQGALQLALVREGTEDLRHHRLRTRADQHARLQPPHRVLAPEAQLLLGHAVRPGALHPGRRFELHVPSSSWTPRQPGSRSSACRALPASHEITSVRKRKPLRACVSGAFEASSANGEHVLRSQPGAPPQLGDPGRAEDTPAGQRASAGFANTTSGTPAASVRGRPPHSRPAGTTPGCHRSRRR